MRNVTSHSRNLIPDGAVLYSVGNNSSTMPMRPVTCNADVHSFDGDKKVETITES